MMEEEEHQQGEHQGRFITNDLIYVTKGCCPDCPYQRRPDAKVSQAHWCEIETKLLAGGHTWECSSITVARMRGAILPQHICCYGYFYQHWNDVDALRYAVEQQHTRSFDISGMQTLTESRYDLNVQQTRRLGSSQYEPFRYCPTDIWEAQHEH